MFGNCEKILYVMTTNFRHILLKNRIENYIPVRFAITIGFPNKVQTFSDAEKNCAKILQTLLGLRSFTAHDIVMKHKKFKNITTTAIEENYSHFLKNGILKDTLKKFPEVLAESEVSLKIAELKEMPYDINVTTPLLCLPYNQLFVYRKSEISDRITLISKYLNIDESEVCQILIKRSFLLSLNLKQLETNLKLLLDNGIIREQILKDLWVLRYTTNLIQERLNLARKNNIEVLKTWMVRAQPEIFETYIRRRSDNKSILGDSSLTQYLSERLECTEEVAKYLICKHPALQHKSLKKINEMIDFLYRYGFKPIHICKVPKILLHSVETTKKRLKELELKGLQLDSLYILTKSQRQYMHYFELLEKACKNKKNATA